MVGLKISWGQSNKQYRDMIEREYDNWIDEIDIRSLEDTGKAILHRKYTKDDKYIDLYLSYPDKALVVAKGITAYLFGNSFSGGIQLPPINMIMDKSNIDIYEYFNKYFSICKTHFIKLEKSKPNSVHSDLNKRFLVAHIKYEKNNFRFCKDYFDNPKYDKNENLLRKEYSKSYIKWIKAKRRQLSLINKIEIGFLMSFCFLIISFLILNFFLIDEQWNLVQKINRLIDNSKSETSKEIGIYIWAGFIGLFSVATIRIRKIFKSHKIK